jgi:transcription elongation factor GreA
MKNKEKQANISRIGGFSLILHHQRQQITHLAETGIYMEYMSQEGYDKLVAELRQLENVELPQVREAIAEARDKGDLSENFEYHAAKREQGRLLSQIRFRQRVLENARVIDRSVLGSDSVGLLSKVEMTNMNNQARMSYTIVSPHEANLREGKISIKSPIAQALLNKKAGDVVEVRVPAGMMKLRIESITLS